MIRRFAPSIWALALVLLVQSGSAWAGTLTIKPDFQGTPTQTQKDLFADAIREWTSCLMGPNGQNVTLTIKVSFMALPAGELGGTSNLKADANGNPMSADIEISNGADMYFGFAEPVPADKFDALTVMKHEVGHALGFAGGKPEDGLGYKKWNDQITAMGTDAIFDKNGLNVMLDGPVTDANGRSHVDPTKYPNDVMQPELGKGTRRHPSDLDYRMLGKAFGYVVCPEPSSLVMAGLGVCGVVGIGVRQGRTRKVA
jgi:PEP-CTERM motif